MWGRTWLALLSGFTSPRPPLSPDICPLQVPLPFSQPGNIAQCAREQWQQSLAQLAIPRAFPKRAQLKGGENPGIGNVECMEQLET